MDKNEILQKVNEIFIDAFGKDDLKIGFETKAADVNGWDSLMQMNLIEMIEDEFNVRFSMEEVVGMANVGAMIDIIASRI